MILDIDEHRTPLLQAGLLTNWGSMGAYLSSELDGLGQAGQSAAEVDRQQWAYVAYTLSALAGLLLLLTLLFISRIKVRAGRPSLLERAPTSASSSSASHCAPWLACPNTAPDLFAPSLLQPWRVALPRPPAGGSGHAQGGQPDGGARAGRLLLPALPLHRRRRLHRLLVSERPAAPDTVVLQHLPHWAGV